MQVISRWQAPAAQSDVAAWLANENAVLVLRNALDPELLNTIKNNVYRLREHIQKTQYINGALTTFGPYLAKHLNSLDDYFAKANETDMLFTNNDDLRAIVREKLCALLNCERLEVAQEPDGRFYAPATVRIHADGVANPLHNDNIMRDAAHTSLKLKNLTRQLSCVVCIQECDEGGELVHYKKRWHQEDEQYKILNGLGYETGVVEGVEGCRFRPQTGDIYLIDPTHYHEILSVKGRDRITMGFFIGFFGNQTQSGVVWT